MSEQDMNAVEQPAEQTAPTESAPVETEAPDVQPEPADAIDQPEKRVSETVPYERFKEVNDKVKQLEGIVSQLAAPEPVPQPVEDFSNSPFEPETAQALDQYFDQKYAVRREAEKAAEFTRRHGEELGSDKILAATVRQLIAEANDSRQYLDQEEAYSQAKALLEQRLAPQVKEARQEASEEARELARQKQQAASVGDTGARAPVKADHELSAAELAAKYNLPRAL